MDTEKQERLDPLFEEAAILIFIYQHGSSSILQRKLSIGYHRAGRIMDQLEKANLVGQFRGDEGRKVNFDKTDLFVKFLLSYLTMENPQAGNEISIKSIEKKILARLKEYCGLA